MTSIRRLRRGARVDLDAGLVHRGDQPPVSWIPTEVRLLTALADRDLSGAAPRHAASWRSPA
jgi:hypothetical protein